MKATPNPTTGGEGSEPKVAIGKRGRDYVLHVHKYILEVEVLLVVVHMCFHHLAVRAVGCTVVPSVSGSRPFPLVPCPLPLAPLLP